MHKDKWFWDLGTGKWILVNLKDINYGFQYFEKIN